MKISSILYTGTLLLAVNTCAHALTLDQVIQTVRETHPMIREAQWDARSAKSHKHAKSWLPDPELEIMAEEAPLSGDGLDRAEMTTYSVSQEIPFPGTLATMAKSLENTYKAKRDFVTSTELQKILEAKTIFFGLVANRNALSDKNAMLGYYRQSLSSYTRIYESFAISNGEGNMMGKREDVDGSAFDDVLMAKMKKAELEVEIHDLEHKGDALEAQLNLIMGREAGASITPLTLPPVKRVPLGAKELEEKLLAQNADLSALKWLIRKSENKVSLAKQTLIPKITPKFQYDQRFNRENSTTLGVSFNVPLWLNRNAAEINAAKAENYRAEAALENTKLVAKTDLYNLLYHARHHYEILGKYRREILPLGKSLVTTAIAAVAAGQASSTATYRKLIDYHEASSMYWEMWVDYQTEYAMLEQLVGEEL